MRFLLDRKIRQIVFEGLPKRPLKEKRDQAAGW